MQIIIEIEEHKLAEVFKCQKRWMHIEKATSVKWFVAETNFIESVGSGLVKVGINLMPVSDETIKGDDIKQICSSYIFRNVVR